MIAANTFGIEYEVYEQGRKAPQWTIEGDLKGEMTLADLLQFTKSNLIVIADFALKEEQAKGFDKNPVVTVDGRVGRPVELVNPLGSIVYTSRKNIDEIIIAIYQSIEERSPVDTGRYRRSNYVFLNGNQVANNMSTLEAWLKSAKIEPKDIIRFVNIQPYARKLERLGVTAQRTQSRTRRSSDKKNRSGTGGRVLAPNGSYFLAARSTKRIYKNNIKIDFKFIPGSQIGLRSTFKNSSGIPGRTRRQKKSAPRTYLYPSILVKVVEGGTL